MRKFLSLGAFLSALMFAGIGMWIPPQGEISGSVLILIAQMLILCTTMLRILPARNFLPFGYSDRAGHLQHPERPGTERVR